MKGLDNIILKIALSKTCDNKGQAKEIKTALLPLPNGVVM